MKQVLFLFLFLAACVQIPSPTNITNTSPASVMNTTESIPVPSSEPTIKEQGFLPFESNVSLKANQIMRGKIKGFIHTIEVIDVTEGSDACLIRVDNSTVLINKDDTEHINDLWIFVADVRAIHSQLENNDVCQLVIA